MSVRTDDLLSTSLHTLDMHQYGNPILCHVIDHNWLRIVHNKDNQRYLSVLRISDSAIAQILYVVGETAYTEDAAPIDLGLSDDTTGESVIYTTAFFDKFIFHVTQSNDTTVIIRTYDNFPKNSLSYYELAISPDDCESFSHIIICGTTYQCLVILKYENSLAEHFLYIMYFDYMNIMSATTTISFVTIHNVLPTSEKMHLFGGRYYVAGSVGILSIRQNVQSNNNMFPLAYPFSDTIDSPFDWFIDGPHLIVCSWSDSKFVFVPVPELVDGQTVSVLSGDLDTPGIMSSLYTSVRRAFELSGENANATVMSIDRALIYGRCGPYTLYVVQAHLHPQVDTIDEASQIICTTRRFSNHASFDNFELVNVIERTNSLSWSSELGIESTVRLSYSGDHVCVTGANRADILTAQAIFGRAALVTTGGDDDSVSEHEDDDKSESDSHKSTKNVNPSYVSTNESIIATSILAAGCLSAVGSGMLS
jgi:hypothetical protein